MLSKRSQVDIAPLLHLPVHVGVGIKLW